MHSGELTKSSIIVAYLLALAPCLPMAPTAHVVRRRWMRTSRHHPSGCLAVTS